MIQPILAALPAITMPLVALIAGVFILIRPALLAKIVAIYLIIIGIVGIIDTA